MPHEKASPGESESREAGFGLNATRLQTELNRLGDRAVEVAYRISLRNSKSSSVRVQVQEQLCAEPASAVNSIDLTAVELPCCHGGDDE